MGLIVFLNKEGTCFYLDPALIVAIDPHLDIRSGSMIIANSEGHILYFESCEAPSTIANRIESEKVIWPRS
jgi:hypothetical protein